MSDKFDRNAYITAAKHHKMTWLERSNGGEMPPIVFAECAGRIKAVVVAPQCDKNMGLTAVQILRIGFNPDAISMLTDARMRSCKSKPGQTAEAATEELKKSVEAGSMQQAVHSGNRGDIIDALVCIRTDSAGHSKIIMLPYSYDGKKAGSGLRWLDDHEMSSCSINAEKLESDKIGYGGYIPDSMAAIMTDKSAKFVKLQELIATCADGLDITTEQRDYHVCRASLRILSEMGFAIYDMLDSPYSAEETAKQEALHKKRKKGA